MAILMGASAATLLHPRPTPTHPPLNRKSLIVASRSRWSLLSGKWISLAVNIPVCQISHDGLSNGPSKCVYRPGSATGIAPSYAMYKAFHKLVNKKFNIRAGICTFHDVGKAWIGS